MSANQWDGEYFDSRNGAVFSALKKLETDRKVYTSFQGSDISLVSSSGWYVESLVSAMSTVFGAIGSVWQIWRLFSIIRLIPTLCELCDEYKEVRKNKKLSDFVSPSHDEVYVACLIRLGSILSLIRQDKISYFYEAKNIAEEIFVEYSNGVSIPVSTILLLKARHSQNPAVPRSYRKHLIKEITKTLNRLTTINLNKEEIEIRIGQGYKTICRLGRMVGYWKACRVSMRYDKSKDLWGKTLIFPGFWLYMIRYYLMLAS